MDNLILEIFLETAEAAIPALQAEGVPSEEIRRDLAQKAFLLGTSIQQVADVNMQRGKEQGIAMARIQQASQLASQAPTQQSVKMDDARQSSEDKGHGLYL